MKQILKNKAHGKVTTGKWASLRKPKTSQTHRQSHRQACTVTSLPHTLGHSRNVFLAGSLYPEKRAGPHKSDSQSGNPLAISWSRMRERGTSLVIQ